MKNWSRKKQIFYKKVHGNNTKICNQEKIKLIFSIPSMSHEENMDFNSFQGRGTKFFRIFKQILMLFNHYGKEGGLFIFVGKKCK